MKGEEKGGEGLSLTPEKKFDIFNNIQVDSEWSSYYYFTAHLSLPVAICYNRSNN